MRMDKVEEVIKKLTAACNLKGDYVYDRMIKIIKESIGLLEATDEIERLVKRELLLEKVALQEKEIERLTAEEKYLNEEVARGVRLNERLEAELQAKIDRLANALQALRDAQNRITLIRDTEEWETAMKLADEALEEHPDDGCPRPISFKG